MKVVLGGKYDFERLFLESDFFSFYDDDIIIEKTEFPDIDMEDLIARHKARYGLVALFCRPGLKLLDFPCGSGYASKLLFQEYKVDYLGAEIDKFIVEYAKRIYSKYGDFIQADLTNVKLNYKFDIIACIEGLEHIDGWAHGVLIEKFYGLLNPGGVLIISMPEAKEKSGPNPKNKFHLWERTKAQFIYLLNEPFKNVQILEQENMLSTGEVQNCLYGICRKEK